MMMSSVHYGVKASVRGRMVLSMGACLKTMYSTRMIFRLSDGTFTEDITQAVSQVGTFINDKVVCACSPIVLWLMKVLTMMDIQIIRCAEYGMVGQLWW